MDRLDHWLRRTFRVELAWWHKHLIAATLVLVVAVAAVFYAGGFRSGATYTAAYYQQHYGATLNAPHPPLRSGVPLPVGPAPAAAAAHVDFSLFERPRDQGSLGQCQCESFAALYDYLYARQNHRGVRFSCAFWYALVGHGQDDGSNLLQYPALLQSVGAVPSSVYSYRGIPTRVMWPVPAGVYRDALSHRYSVVVDPISMQDNGGQGAVNLLEQALAHGRPVNIGLPVFSGPGSNGAFDAATSGFIDLPSDPANAVLAGRHTVVGIEYDRNMVHDGVRGWIKVANWWGGNWGLTLDGKRVPGHEGYGYISERFVATYAYQLASLRRNPLSKPQLPPPPVFRQPGPAGDVPRPPPHLSSAPRAPNLSGGSIYVQHVWARDVCDNGRWSTSCGRWLDLAPRINAAARRIGVSPVGFLALIEAECSLHTHSYTCDRLGGGIDFSFGCCQITVSTAAQFGVGNGYFDGYNGPNATLVRNYENVASQGIHLASLVLNTYAAYERRVGCYAASDFPNLYVAWNAGPAQSCGFLSYPSGQAGSNFYSNFMGWMRVAYSYATTVNPYPGRPPRPRPFHFPLGRWNSYRAQHRLAPISPWANGHGRLTWPASIFYRHQKLGGVVDQGHWSPRARVMHYPFAHGDAWAWPRFHRAKVVTR